MNRTRALLPAVAVVLLATLSSACDVLEPRSRKDYWIMRECTNFLHIELEGSFSLPEALTVQAIYPDNTSCTRHCPTDLRGNAASYRVLDQVLPSSSIFDELSLALPPGSLCATGGRYRVATASVWEDGSLRTLGFCCSDTPPDQAVLRLSAAPTCNYRGSRLRELHFSYFAPEQLKLVFYLPQRTITTTVTPEYEVYHGADGACKGADMTIDLRGLQD